MLCYSLDFAVSVFSPSFVDGTVGDVLGNSFQASIINKDSRDITCGWYTSTNTQGIDINVKPGKVNNFFFDVNVRPDMMSDGIFSYSITFVCEKSWWLFFVDKKEQTFGPYYFNISGVKIAHIELTESKGKLAGLEDMKNDNSDDSYPVIFVHGHNPFEVKKAFGSIGWEEFQDMLSFDGYENMGYVLPSDFYSQMPVGIWNGRKISVLTTYYANESNKVGDELGDNDDRNITEYANRLKEVVETVKRNTGKDKVIIVAHSMGGLVSREYIDELGGEDSVAKLVMVGTPNYGISDPISILCGNTPLQFAIGFYYSIADGQVSDFLKSPRKNTPECLDMKKNSEFLMSLNKKLSDKVKYLAVVGLGTNTTNCPNNEKWDGVVCSSSVKLEGVETFEYSVKKRNDSLHLDLINPSKSPEVYMRVVDFIKG
ncbi:MAG: alpha/beta fold hydrolase [Candidatus Woesearchaeota archaeon]